MSDPRVGFLRSDVERFCQQLDVLATLCDILHCTPADLIATSAQNLPARRAVGEEAPIDLTARRP
ncbi:helix-turn-helix domain-containing protein [Streptomyces sp. NBC_01450]|uniref:helix-turn-helix domain-containing protein n=1 Tax=Streptomyces sp. NBC_01450 TaxID=2903871 RepID=UPI003FCD1B89